MNGSPVIYMENNNQHKIKIVGMHLNQQNNQGKALLFD